MRPKTLRTTRPARLTRLFVFPNGVAKFGKVMPHSSCYIVCEVTSSAHRKQLEATMRLAHDNKTRLIPGMPEAKTRYESFIALHKWKGWALI